MQVRTEDLVKFYKDRIVKRKLIIEQLEKEYREAEIEFENKFFPKFFGKKYKETDAGWNDRWIINSFKSGIKSYEAILVKLEYCVKMTYFLSDIDVKDENSFFEFAKERNLPY